MKPIVLFIALLTAAAAVEAQQTRTFTSADGKTITDRLVRYDLERKEAMLEERGRIALNAFSEKDQQYILRWNQIHGFQSTMRFKINVEKNTWASMKHEQTVTPHFMDVFQLPGKATPSHNIIMADDYEEYNAVYLQAEGYTLTLRNQNLFPLENIVVESKILFEQEYYVIPDDLFSSSKSEYTETIVSNKVKYLSETLPVIVPREEVALYSETAVMVDHQLSRNTLVSVTEEEDEGDGDDEDDGGDEEVTETVEGFGDWEDHARRRKGDIIGVWFRIGMEGPDGEMVWREVSEPESLKEKLNWDSPFEDE